MRVHELTLFFNDGDLGATLDAYREKMRQEVDAASEDYLLNTDIDEWVDYLVSEYSIEVPVLDRDGMEVEDQGETNVDVSHQYMQRAIADPSQPAYVKGRALLLRIPFSGEKAIFQLRASQYSLNPPRAMIGEHELMLSIEYPTDTDRPDIKGIAEDLLQKVEQGIEWARRDCETHNRTLAEEARRAIEQRRSRVLADHAHLDDLGIPVRKRTDAPRTYQAPGIKRKRSPSKPRPRAGQPAPAEPTMVAELYEHTLQVIRSWIHAMERTPADYAGAGEEKLRDALLIMLNTHYEGQGQAEAFNKSGKTDILIRVDDRNIFIAECKVWKGPRSLADALEQLLGYATWRDTKLALIFFVRQADIRSVVAKGRVALEAHDAFKGWRETSEEGEFRAEIVWPDDPARRADLAMYFVHLPRS